MKVIVSCSGKFHAFALSEQLERFNYLNTFYTSYASQKNHLLKKLIKRNDKENIRPDHIQTHLTSAFLHKFTSNHQLKNDMFDGWVASKIKNTYQDFDIFIGWSGMSLKSIETAKSKGKTIILERGSSHISYQKKILSNEYEKHKIPFIFNDKTIIKELAEYELADFISIPSTFVKNTFLNEGIANEKLIQNPYGVSSFFKITSKKKDSGIFRIIYLGSLTIRKGLVYLFEALNQLPINTSQFEFWAIGGIDEEVKPILNKYIKSNWKIYGHIEQSQLPDLISQCDIAVHPSIEEGLSMVIAQLLSCGVPVIATTNTGGEDIIKENNNGFIVPICDSEAIKNKLLQVFHDKPMLTQMKANSSLSIASGFTWNDYGERYVKNLHQLSQK